MERGIIYLILNKQTGEKDVEVLEVTPSAA